MKKLIGLLSILFICSCAKKDNINHYINNKTTKKELIANGFYKYSMSYLEGSSEEEVKSIDSRKKDPTVPVKFDTIIIEAYSNVKPLIVNGVPKGPIPIFMDIPENDINGKIITYFFRNDTLEFKSILTSLYDKGEKKELFKTKMDIKKYYDNLKISNKEIPLEKLRNHNDSLGLRVRFIINNYESYFYLSDRNEMITYYLSKKRGDEDKLIWDFYDKNSPYKFIENGK
jgi:hypothetical protein